MSISTLHFIKNKITYLVEENTITQKVYRLTKKMLDYSVQHKYAIAMSLWSYVIIEAGVAAAEMNFGVDYIYDVDSCRETLCSYWNNHGNIIQGGTTAHPFQSRCTPSTGESQPYSLIKCLEDLCNYLNAIGEKFYACADTSKRHKVVSNESEMANPTWDLFKKVCPVRHFRSVHNLKQLGYINRCIKKLCSSANELHLSPEFMELCEAKSINELYKLLAIINKSIRELKKTSDSDPLAETTAVSGLIGALAGLVGGAAGVATTVITYRAAKTATSVLSGSIPSLQQSVANIARSTIETTIATIRETASNVGEMIPMETLHVLRDLSETIEKQSVYYSFEKALGDGSLQHSNAGTSGGSSGGETQETNLLESAGPSGSAGTGVGGSLGSIASGGVGAVGSGGLGAVASGGAAVLGGISIVSTGSKRKGGNPGIELVDKEENPIPEVVKKVVVAITSAPEEENLFSSIIGENCIYDEDPLNRDSHNITIESIDCLKSSLPKWHNAFCFYERSNDFLACRFPLLRHQLESQISYFLIELQKFFSENRSTLCHFSHEDLWCNWNKFLDSIFSHRPIEFFYDKECPWDTFGLKIAEIANDTYRMDARGSCYNETEWIKI